VVIFAAGLVVSALVLGGWAGACIDRSPWSLAHPGTALVCWAGVLTGTVTAVAGVVAVALLSPPAPAHGLLEWFDHCLSQHGHSRAVDASVISVALVVACCARLVRGVPRLWRAMAHRRQHRKMLRIVAREDDRHPDVWVIDHPVPVAYCLPARSRPIVVSSGAQARLDANELAAVLAHERAHLRHRHHLLLLLLDVACVLLPWLPTVRRAKISLPPLLEMAADDAAARRCGRRALSAALLRLTVLPGPAGALAAAGTRGGDPAQALARRLVRLETATAKVSNGASVLAWVTAIATIAGPLAIAGLTVAAIPLPC
jgi:beta-lactamase regulating signal transducer with metallopeptidase domain